MGLLTGLRLLCLYDRVGFVGFDGEDSRGFSNRAVGVFLGACVLPDRILIVLLGRLAGLGRKLESLDAGFLVGTGVLILCIHSPIGKNNRFLPIPTFKISPAISTDAGSDS